MADDKAEIRCSSRHRKFAVHGLLPDVGIHVAANGLLLFGGEGWCGEFGKHLIKNEHLDIGLTPNARV